MLAGLPHQGQKGVAGAVALLPAVQVHLQIVARQIAQRALAGHHGGQGLIETGVVADIQPPVDQLMNQQLHQGRAGAVDHRRGERVREPPQGGVSNGAAHVGVLPLRVELLGQGLGVGAVEVTAVAQAPQQQVAPGARLQGIRRRGDHIPDHRIVAQMHIILVDVAGRQRQGLIGEREHVTGQGQLAAHRRRRLRIGHHLRHRLARAHQVHVALHRLAVVAQLAARQKQPQAASCKLQAGGGKRSPPCL